MSNSTQEYTKYFKGEIIPLIDSEMEHSNFLNECITEINAVIMIKEVGGDADWKVISSSRMKRGIRMLKSYNVEELNRLKQSYEESLKGSRYKEKFLRYSHNLNYGKALAYHKKIQEYQVELSEDMREADQNGEPYCFAVNDADEDTVVYNEKASAYIEFCKEMTKSYNWRKDTLKGMKKFLKVKE